ncbi:MAG: peptide deformylase [Acidimicrobiaceae bacterium]|nr:peptide deformylase [Acidimicrobiaceae bacterium]
MSIQPIRTYGDPVLKTLATDVVEIDSKIAKLVADMIETMYEAPGVGLAAPQVGVEKRLFVYDIGDGPLAILNPRITESDGEWVYEEGCLSVPGLYFEIVRPAKVLLEGIDLDGNEVSIEASELLGRVFQHEVDHLDGILLLERLDEVQLKAAKKELRKRAMEAGA